MLNPLRGFKPQKLVTVFFKNRTGVCVTTTNKVFYYSSQPQCLMDHLKQRIQVAGPITISSYMKECLSNPIWGYYMKKDVFGSQGDFTTSPEISQMFGELLAIWYFIEWTKMGKPIQVQLVELGPGRGTMMVDILRVMKQFKPMYDCLSIHFVEISDKMIELQKKNLGLQQSADKYVLPDSTCEVNWYQKVQDVPPGLSFFLAHEFFDALPVNLFQKVNNKWKETLVNLSECKEKLELVMSPGTSAVGRSFIPSNYPAELCEVCPDGAVIASHISENIAMHGGCGLFVDYGVGKSDRHSIRAFKDHKLLDSILECPGDADITANVDFGFLKRYTHKDVECYGPITQMSFLMQMGIRERLQALLRNATAEQAKNLVSSYEYLVSPDKMGEKFKVMAIGKPDIGKPSAF